MIPSILPNPDITNKQTYTHSDIMKLFLTSTSSLAVLALLSLACTSVVNAAETAAKGPTVQSSKDNKAPQSASAGTAKIYSPTEGPVPSPTVQRISIDSSIKENHPETFHGDWYIYKTLMIDSKTPDKDGIESQVESQVGLTRTESDPILRFVIPKECKSPGSAILSDAKVVTVSKSANKGKVHLTFKKDGNVLFHCDVPALNSGTVSVGGSKPAKSTKKE